MNEVTPSMFQDLQGQVVDLTTKVAVLSTKVDALTTQNDEKMRILEELRKGMCEVNLAFAEAKGGWKFLISVGTGAATIGAALVEAWHNLRGRP